MLITDSITYFPGAGVGTIFLSAPKLACFQSLGIGLIVCGRQSGNPSLAKEDFTFDGVVRRFLENTALTKRFQALLVRVGLPTMRFHGLRHSSATLLMSQHIPARVVMERLGHSTINLTLDTYSHVIQALNQEAADAMDRVLGG